MVLGFTESFLCWKRESVGWDSSESEWSGFQ